MASSFALPAECVLAQASAVHAALAESLTGVVGDTLRIDATGVREADISLVQLLVAAGHTAAAEHVRIVLDPSPVVSELLFRSGLPGWPSASAG